MSSRIIDARNRFSGTQKPAGKQQIEADLQERRARQQREARKLRGHLKATPRLPVEDRSAIARNLGRVIERVPGEKPTLTVRQFLFSAFGEDEAVSKEKKRKRYFRFDGEQLDGDLNASGATFLRLSEHLADFLNPEFDVEMRRDQMLLAVCDGTSFYGPSRPRLKADVPLFEKFRDVMQRFVDRIARETDVIAYFDEVRNYSIRNHPHTMHDCAPEVLANLHRQTFPVDRFEHLPGDEEGTVYEEYSRLRLAGFDIQAEGVSLLYPKIRLARIYVPRPVLCLPAYVPTAKLEELRTRALTEAELKEALDRYEPKSYADKTDDDIRKHAIQEWRNRREHEMWRAAIREAGLDPDNMDWHGFEDELDGEALHGAAWHTFWQAMSVDMHLVADGRPEALRLGLSFSSLQYPHWTDAAKDLAKPADDDLPDKEKVNCVWFDENPEDPFVPWFPVGDRSYVCRGWKHNWGADVGREADFEPALPDYVDGLAEEPLWPLQGAQIWQLLTMKLKDWQAFHHSVGLKHRAENEPPSLRPLFDAPKRWAQAPDGSLAAAMLSSLAFGEGPERLDDKFIAQVNKMVRCFRDMKEGLAGDFEDALVKHGYHPDR
ncbi:hypothetical protein [Pseudoruegeria sp. SHC-113]|uniref:hypothetical protein n=1 Tax=Pseudoruegeria sp. SHC-113 TaxID=2855439 RepID=UPI0021BA7C56|nr:hypothetical protein [Pseudoruegeria sp. SHC-113]MCT8159365.1 hypothetical protein [Pseudoruegeria sp. SHC-113]